MNCASSTWRALTFTLTVTSRPKPRLQCRHARRDLLQHDARDVVQKAELGRELDEGSGHVDRAVGLDPARERFEPHGAARGDTHLRLERRAKEPFPRRDAQPLLELLRSVSEWLMRASK